MILLVPVAAYPQKGSNFHVDAGLVQNHQGFLELFDGVVGVSGGYNHELVNNLYGGIHLQTSFLNRTGTTNRAAFYLPGINIHYVISLTAKIGLVPFAGVSFAALNLSNKEFDYREVQTGYGPGTGIRLLWKRDAKAEFYLYSRFDYIHLSKDDDFTRLENYRNMYQTSFGLGIRIKSEKE